MKSYFHNFISFLYCTTLLVFPARLYAQQLSSKLYTVNDGLPGNNVVSAYQDNYGYLWVALTEGVSRFDGRQFVNYTLAEGLPSLFCITFFQDSKNRLWLGTDNGAAQFKNNRFITYPVNDNAARLYVLSFFETKNKKIWITTNYGVYEFEDSAWKKISLYPGFDNKMCRGIAELNNELYVLYYGKFFCKQKNSKWFCIDSLTNDLIYNTIAVYNNKIFIATHNNIYEVHNYKLSALFQKDLQIHNYFSYCIDTENRLWLSTNTAIKVSKPNNFQNYSNSLVTNNARIYYINRGAGNYVWAGTDNGLLKMRWIAYTEADKKNNPLIQGIDNIIPLADNSIVLSSGLNAGLIILKNNHYQQIKPPSQDKSYYKDLVDAYTFDDQHALWMQTRFRKLLKFENNKLEDLTPVLHHSFSKYYSFDLTFSKQRHQFFACADSTLLYGTAKGFNVFIPANTKVRIDNPTKILILENGLIVLFIDGKGLYCIDTANNLLPLNDAFGLNKIFKSASPAVKFCNGEDNNFWIAVPGLGLYEYSYEKNNLPAFKQSFTIAQGLQSNNILSMIKDRANRLWIINTNGLDIMQKDKHGNWQIFNYASTNELKVKDFYYERFAMDTSGNIWLSSPDRILKFNSADIKLQQQTPGVIIEKVSLSFKETNWNDYADSLYGYYQLPYKPILKYNQNSLGISFNAVNLSISNSSPQYSYKLFPLDTAWSIPSKIKSVSFAKLPAGKYQFLVKAKDMASGWSRPDIFSFTITSPFWNEWWFRLVIIVMAALIIINIFRARIKKIRRDVLIQNQLRDLETKALKAQMNPHFIYNALNSIQALVADDKKEEGIYYIGSFSRLLRQVLDNSENNIISLDKELETIGLYIQLEALRLDMRLQYKKNIPESIITEFEKIPPLILQPFVENALWHGLSSKQGEKEITISISLKDNWLLCDIKDNGVGRIRALQLKHNTASFHQSKGIDITYKRLIDFNEDTSVVPIEFFDLYDDKKNAAGTRVTVRIKRKTASLSFLFNK